MPEIAVSTWSLHRLLGITYANGPGVTPTGKADLTFGRGELTLEDLPAELARRGYNRVEICHFNLASQDASYLSSVRTAFEASGVVIQTLLIDDGDITDPAARERDSAWIASWIESAALLGAQNARVIAGKARASPDTIAMAVNGLKAMTELGKSCGVRIVTENWFDTLSAPDAVHRILDGVGPDLGFLADTGNWRGPEKYADLESIFGRAELCHAKADFGHGLAIDAEDYRKSINAAIVAGYSGPFALIFDGDGNEWAGLAAERAFLEKLFI
ncbi:MAG: sugar phosphate isomerase/epimerase [Rhizobiaceae bacterium]